jgi:hypothetical protein
VSIAPPDISRNKPATSAMFYVSSREQVKRGEIKRTNRTPRRSVSADYPSKADNPSRISSIIFQSVESDLPRIATPRPRHK